MFDYDELNPYHLLIILVHSNWENNGAFSVIKVPVMGTVDHNIDTMRREQVTRDSYYGTPESRRRFQGAPLEGNG